MKCRLLNSLFSLISHRTASQRFTPETGVNSLNSLFSQLLETHSQFRLTLICIFAYPILKATKPLLLYRIYNSIKNILERKNQ